MDYKSFLSFIVFIILIEFQTFFTVHGGILKRRDIEDQVEENKNASSVDNRFNFNLNRGHAHAVSPNGRYSASDALTYGVNVGIQRPGYGYQPLYSNAGGYSNSFGSPGGPQTWANGNSRVRPGYAGGSINSGFYGGRGQAQSNSFSAVHRIPLDPFSGTVLLHNLPTKKEKGSPVEKTDSQENAAPIESTDNKENVPHIESTDNKENAAPIESTDNKELVLTSK